MSVRSQFKLDTKLIRWYPRHMSKGFHQMERTLRKVDCIVEVHDSRIPFSGRNVNFVRNLSAAKPHILLMNKMDLFDMRYKTKVKNRIESETNTKCVFVDACHQNTRINGFEKILPTVVDLIRSSDRFNREDKLDYSLMIIGVPNVGKSTIINRLRNTHLGVAGRATITGATPGVTKSVLERIKINANPPIYLYDTPGVLEPRIDSTNIESTMRCALCATLSDQLIGIVNIADYLIYWLNRRKIYSYVNFLKLDKPSDDIKEVLVKGAVSFNFIKEFKCPETGKLLRAPDQETTAEVLLKAFRKGHLGRVFLDDDIVC